MNIFISILLYVKGIFVLKKGSYIVLSVILTAVSSPFLNRIIALLKSKLNKDDVIINFIIIVSVFFIILITISVDTILGLMAARHSKVEITNEKGLMSVFKMIFYSIWLFIIFSFQIIAFLSAEETIVSMFRYVIFFSAILITLWEFRSIGKNLKLRFDKDYPIFNLIDKIIDILERRVGTFLENAVCKKPN